ncbi:glycosyltransferase family 4 protein [Patescibacteria group bacterium]
MNILVIKNPYRSQPHGGGELHTMEVMKHLREQGHKIYFAGTCRYLLEMAKAKEFSVTPTEWAGQEAVSEDALLKFLFSKGRINKSWKKFLQRAKETKKIDLVYILSWNEKFLVPPIAKKLGMKVVFVEHVLLGRFIKANPWRNSYIKNANQAITIAVSKAVKQSVVDCGVDSDKVKVVYNGVDLNAFPVSPERSTNEEVRIGTISRLCRQKGLEDLIKATAVLKITWPEIEVDIVGRGDAKGKLKRLIKSLGLEENVHLLGSKPRHQLSRFLETLDIFTYTPTYGEAFGLALAEAGLAGLPSVVTNVGGVPEVVCNKQTGIVVPPHDIELQARAIGFLIENGDKRQQMGEAARKRIQQYFSRDRMLAEITKIIESK